MRKWVVGLVLIVLTCSGAITLLAGRSNGSVGPRPTTTVQRGDIADVVVAIGAVQPDTSVTVKAKVVGIVEYVGAEAGDVVTQGQIIVELDKDILKGEVAAAEAEVSVAEAALAQAQAEVEVARSDRDFQEGEHRRAQNLREQGLVSSQELENAGNVHRGSRERTRRSEAMLQAAKAGVKKARVALQLRRDRLSFATLRSPMDGVLLSRPVEIGSAVADITSYDQTVFVVGDMSTLILDGEVDETEIGRVRLGQQARVQLEAFADEIITGSVTRIAPQGVEENHIVRFTVEITLDDTAIPLRAQLTGDAEIIVDAHQDVLLLDERAIRYDFDGPFAEWPPASPEEQPAPVRLTLGFSDGEQAEVLTGLAEGDSVLLPAER